MWCMGLPPHPAAAGAPHPVLEKRQPRSPPPSRCCHGLCGRTHVLGGDGAGTMPATGPHQPRRTPRPARGGNMRKSSGKKGTRLQRLKVKAKAHHEAVQTTLGELVAAAFDTVGNEVK